jgi:TatD DNase family protein
MQYIYLPEIQGSSIQKGTGDKEKGRGENKLLIDSHAHLDMEDYADDIEDVLDRALAGGISNIISVGIDIPSSQKALALAERHDFIYSTVGFHPHNADDADTGKIDELIRLASASKKVVAWGEIGLDFYRNYSHVKNQIEIFELQLDTAIDLNLPIIIHDREAHDDILKIVNKRKSRSQKGVIHCFSGNYDLAMSFIELGYYISIPGTVTYKNAAITQEVAEKIPIERLLIETDAPFLAPLPLRGKRNEPLFIRHTAEKIARLRDMDFDDLALKTSLNAKKLFGLP